MKRRDLLLALAALATPAAGAADDPDLPLATDLRADGRDAQARRIPLVVLFSIPGCPHCREVRRSHLRPLSRDPERAALAIVRQANVGGGENVVGFDGVATTHGALARAHGIRFAPVVAFWDGTGQVLAQSLNGMLLPDFYGAYLDQSLEASLRRLRG